MRANSSRARILDRIRKAQVAVVPEVDGVVVDLAQIFPRIDDPMQRFLAECEANLTEVKCTCDSAESLRAFSKLLSAVPPGPIFVEDDSSLRRFLETFAGREVLWSTAGPAPEHCQATITLCDGLIAQTGSIVNSTRNGGRCGSIVAPTHIVYATTDQLVPDVTTALRAAMSSGALQSSYFGLISGSSRTADIEKRLVQGAHGPRKLAIVLEAR